VGWKVTGLIKAGLLGWWHVFIVLWSGFIYIVWLFRVYASYIVICSCKKAKFHNLIFIVKILKH